MQLASKNPQLVWVILSESASPVFSDKHDFSGSLDEAVADLQSRANRGEFDFGQVLEADGRVYRNIAPHAAP